MSAIERIEKAVAELPPEEFAAFRAWFEVFEAQRFDEAVARDASRGLLDRLAEDALAAHQVGLTREL